MSATLDYTPEQQAAIDRATALANRFYLEWIKPTAQASAGVDRAAPQALQRCECKTPVPKHHEGGVYLCATCGQDLRIDQDGKPYRRYPGDLDTVEQLASRRVLEIANKSQAEMLELVNSLPAEQQRRLMKLPRRQFERRARHMIKVHQAIKQHAADLRELKDPNTRRRNAQLSEKFADMIDEIAGIAEQRRNE